MLCIAIIASQNAVRNGLPLPFSFRCTPHATLHSSQPTSRAMTYIVMAASPVIAVS
jgi:hypothetical protein